MKDEHSHTPLMIATQEKQPKYVEFLANFPNSLFFFPFLSPSFSFSLPLPLPFKNTQEQNHFFF